MAKTTKKKFDLRKAVTETTAPVYAYIGMTDLLIERFREATLKAGETAEKNRAEFAALPGKVQENANELMEELQNAPAKAREMAAHAQEQYEELVTRGEKLVDRIRNQQSTKDLVAQAKHTVEMTEDVVDSARKSFMDVEKSAKATFTTGRKEAAKLVDTVVEDAKEARTEAAGAVKRTRSAAKRTTTTAKNRTAKTGTAAKTAGTEARKTATATRKATKKAAAKVGD